MLRVLKFGAGLLVGALVLARFGLLGDAAALAMAGAPERHMSADNPWSKDYVAVASPATRSSYYPNCAAAWRAGAAPIEEGEPGYRFELDGDGDGIACEPYHGR
uniref:excalibur calcium-binding domain-containing protein n=1 Tax=Altererythrobacter segetis TaxID=1104773 RepID=UPI001409E21B|nr:excalibur calcium-binding domain-containing protein [Altererythrobacter segetis]